MNILQRFELKTKNKIATIGIGLGNLEISNNKILQISERFLKRTDSEIFLIGDKSSINGMHKQNNLKSRIHLIESNVPEEYIFELLDKHIIQAFVRGSFSSNEFLRNLKTFYNIEEINRLALLETVNKHQFFYGPVGIDECNSLRKKINFIELALNEFKLLNIIPNISILSGGRESDFGRDETVDKTIKDSTNIIQIMKKKYRDLQITHDQILIEKAISNKSNLIIAPDGISGNLIYRTLVHLGGGNAYGAIYMGLKKNIIDTSRVAETSEIQGALTLALALAQ